MTPGNNGASTPEDDDPFGYLYADGQANGATPPSGGGGYGYPGSVNRVRAVGERQYGQQQPGYGQQAPTAQYGQQGAPTAPYGQVPQQGAYGQPNAHYAAPETVPGESPTGRQSSGGGGRGRGPNTKGLLIGAIAVVAAVVIGIGIAMMNDNSNDNKSGNTAGSTPSQSQSAQPSQSASSSASAGDLPTIDAKALNLGPGVSRASDTKGAKADGGVYVTGFNQVGAKVTWTVNGIEKAGSYRLYVRYDIPGVDADATLTVNGKANAQPLGMKNFIGSPKGDLEKGWQSTWAPVNLSKGTNVLEISCGQGNQCNAFLDQLWLQ
ncbi:carbohydrate-binding protein [Streptomyces sp. RLB1-33]|uniref:carbohydrate-binding protein n=1 Tax=Streptomyces mirabilis TaxID=68239 RepID=UPI00143E87DA|nr:MULTISPECIES: carbohydrate-binding protein [Streptomyces]QIY71814.1 carbohydrate-binding protein [Streptomyces sp. RLB1-33]QUW81207.1 carbohydrate-binding protein [Streptomyces mirabilis]